MSARGMAIVGAGECGVRAAAALRDLGYAGPVTLIGAERHPPYERPPLSKSALAEGEPAPRTIYSEAALQALGIDWRGGVRATALDRASRRVRLDDGGEIAYDKLLLATGAVPRRLPEAEGDARAHYLRTFDEAAALSARLVRGARVVVIGGGFIGLELAAAARQRGCAVTVIEPQPRLLMRAVPAPVAAAVHALHEARGTTIRLGATIAAIAGGAVVLADGENIAADTLVIGVGAAPEAALAAAAGLSIDNGVAVDAALRTDDPHIFAAGDCCSFPHTLYGGRRLRLESWRNAQEQGAHAARNMLGADAPFAAVPWFWSDQYDFTLQVAGLPDEGRRLARRDLGDAAFLLFHLADDGRLVAASGIGPGNAIARDMRIAEMLIARRAYPSAERLSSPDVKMKALLADALG